jgi:hypothetical protein
MCRGLGSVSGNKVRLRDGPRLVRCFVLTVLLPLGGSDSGDEVGLRRDPVQMHWQFAASLRSVSSENVGRVPFNAAFLTGFYFYFQPGWTSHGTYDRTPFQSLVISDTATPRPMSKQARAQHKACHALDTQPW